MRFLYTMSLFTSLERIRNGLDHLFVFKEPKKEVKKDSMTLLYTMSIFNKPGKKLKWTWTFDTKF